MKGQAIDLEKILAYHISYKGLHKELSKLNNNEINYPIKNGKKT